MRIYKFSHGTPAAKLKPQFVGETLEDIEHEHGALTADIVVQESTPKDAPLHPCFEWNNLKAAHQYRLEQARRLIRSVRLVINGTEDDEEPETIRAFHHVGDVDEGTSRYINHPRVISDEKIREQVIEEALSYLDRWQKKYGHLIDLIEAANRVKKR
jgi:hypothetical protein